MNDKTLKTLFSSAKQDWETPKKFYDQLDQEFHFDLDVCATEENKKCPKYYSIIDDALSKEWHGTCFMNPPYGREIKHWIKKAHDEAQAGQATVVVLIPSRTGTAYFHSYIYNKPNVEIRFIKGRLKFGNSNNSAPFDSMVVIFHKNIK
jgi:site-specific DNA-methyltransferase (adenine-specific)